MDTSRKNKKPDLKRYIPPGRRQLLPGGTDLLKTIQECVEDTRMEEQKGLTGILKSVKELDEEKKVKREVRFQAPQTINQTISLEELLNSLKKSNFVIVTEEEKKIGLALMQFSNQDKQEVTPEKQKMLLKVLKLVVQNIRKFSRNTVELVGNCLLSLGVKLERDCTEELDKLFCQIRNMFIDSEQSTEIRQLLLTCIESRARGWMVRFE